MRIFQRIVVSFVFAVVAIGSLAAADPAGEFPLKDGDVWVMAGDSITAQHLHSNYFEAFCFARYPEFKFAFRNSGVGGHTIPSTLARFEYDIAAWKPTVVSVELGMNDAGGSAKEKFLENMGTMVERIRQAGARPVILSASPVNDGTLLANVQGRNVRLHDYATGLQEFCTKEKIPYGDQFHELVDLWGHNKPSELLANSLANLKQLASDDRITGVEHLREFLAAQAKDPNQPVSMQGDAVHPGPPGQLMMAAALLKELGARSQVSSATIDATGKVVEAKDCQISDVAADGGKLAFTRLDERLPFPLPDETRAVVALYPTILELSQYTLKVPGLKPGSYTLKINDTNVAAYTAEELAAGVNLTNLKAPAEAGGTNPIADQSRKILAAVAAKEGAVSIWRGLSQRAHAAGADPKLKVDLAELGTKVEQADELIRKAARPQALRFEIASAK
jgi:lysophospholipase L1-like esterase